MIKLTILIVLKQPNGILDLKKDLIKLNKISAVREDLLRIAWKCMKMAKII